MHLSTTLWLALAVVVVIVVCAAKYSFRFTREVFQQKKGIHWSHRARIPGCLYCRSRVRRTALFVLAFLLCTIIAFFGLPLCRWPRVAYRAARKRCEEYRFIPPPLPLVYTNQVNGILAVVTAGNYEEGRRWHTGVALDGRVGEGDPFRVYPTFLFRHQSAKLDPDDMPFVSGWISDFQREIAPKCRVEKRADIYVPFASSSRRKRVQERESLARHQHLRDLAGARFHLLDQI